MTYEIVCSKAKAKAPLLKAFLKSFVASDAQAKLQDIGYAPLPAEVQTKVAAAIDARP